MRVAASSGCCVAVDLRAAARDSSSGGGACDPLVGAADAAGAAGWGATLTVPCWLPMIQPIRTPKNTPQTPTMIESRDTVAIAVGCGRAKGATPLYCLFDPIRQRRGQRRLSGEHVRPVAGMVKRERLTCGAAGTLQLDEVARR